MVTASGAVVGVTVATGVDQAGNPDGRGFAIPIGVALNSVHWILAAA